jgi:Repeat of unknown function (DUF5648)
MLSMKNAVAIAFFYAFILLGNSVAIAHPIAPEPSHELISVSNPVFPASGLPTDRPKASAPFTVVDVRRQLCFENIPLDYVIPGFSLPPADIAAGLYRTYPVSATCSSLAIGVYTGYLFGSNLTIKTFALNTDIAIAFCQTGLVENCAVGTANNLVDTFTVISRSGDRCFEAFPASLLQTIEGNSSFQILLGGVTCRSLGMPILSGYLAGTRQRVPVYSSSESSGQILCASGIIEGCTLVVTTPSAATVLVYEFFNAPLNRYFRTSDPKEIALLRDTPSSGEQQTGDNFVAFANPVSRASPVCRFYGSVSPGPNSHFYSAEPSECNALRSLQSTTPASDKRWNFEGTAFYVFLPLNGACQSGASTPVYRAYNRGNVTGRDSNHRFTTNLATYNAMLTQGWAGEGVVMCTP